MTLTADALLRRFMLKAKLRHLQVLMKLAELGSMRRAAQDLNMTQPAVSQLVAEMEQLMETQLFVRHARGVTPTEAAQDLLFAARRIREALQDGSEAIASRLNENSGVVRVYATACSDRGVFCTGGLGLFPRSTQISSFTWPKQPVMTLCPGLQRLRQIWSVHASLRWFRRGGYSSRSWRMS